MIYFKYVKMSVKSLLQYRVSFILTICGQFTSSLCVWITVAVLFLRFDEIGGFTYNEILICYATTLAAFSMAECFARGFDLFPGVLSNGTFDRILLRPRNTIIQTLGTKFELTRLGRFAQGVMMLAYAIPRCGVEWDVPKAIVLGSMVICGSIVFAALFVVYASICFVTLEGLEFMNIFTDGGREFGTYPYAVYGKGVLRFATYIIPLALTQYYPLLYLIGRDTRPLHALTPFIALLFVIPCLLLWRLGIRRYVSIGA